MHRFVFLSADTFSTVSADTDYYLSTAAFFIRNYKRYESYRNTRKVYSLLSNAESDLKRICTNHRPKEEITKLFILSWLFTMKLAA